MDVRVGLWRKLSAEELMLLNYGVGEDSWESLGLQGDPTSPRDSQESSATPQFKSINSLALSFLYSPTFTSIHDYWKNHSPDFVAFDLCCKVMSLLFNMLSRLVKTFLPRSKCLLISWLQSPSAVILEPPKIKSDTVSNVFPSISHEVMGPDAMILVFWMLRFNHQPSLEFFTLLNWNCFH